jgi:hypothetical protein
MAPVNHPSIPSSSEEGRLLVGSHFYIKILYMFIHFYVSLPAFSRRGTRGG